MSKMKFSSGDERGRFARFLSSKGFYGALAVCLIGASAATWMAVDRTITGIEQQNQRLIQNDNGFVNFPQLEETQRVQEGVPRTPERGTPERETGQFSPPSSSSPTAPSSSPPSDGSEQQQERPASSPQSPGLSYALPVRGQVTNPFSSGELVRNNTLGDWRTHDGVDIAAARGDDILAAADGTVTEVRNDPLWGTVVVLSHPDGNETVYKGLSSNLPINEGDTVLIRQVIGKLEGVPCEIADGIHLHYAMRKDGKWVDPLSVMPRD